MSFASPREGLFMSSSPTHIDTGPTEEVDNILTHVRQIDHLDPIFDALVSNNPDAFFDGFSRKVELIKSRTQAFEVCHVTVFDKVLLALTKNGNDLNTAPAIAYFCEEFLGIPSRMSLSKKDEILSHALHVPAALTQALTSPLTHGNTCSADGRSISSDTERALSSSMNTDDLAAIVAETGNVVTIRIWKVYETAKQEYYAIDEPTSVDKQEAAKFLRDTAENALQHLAGKDADPRLTAELGRALSVAKHTAEALSGGRKRKFDEPVKRAQQVVERPAGRRQSIYTQEIRTSCQRTDHRHMPNERYHGDFSDNYTQAIDRYPRHRRQSEDRLRRQLLSPELSPHDRRDGKRSKKQPGRGHSGIPFGYSRDVDSYQPAS